MNQHQKLPPATVDLSCDECGELIGTVELKEHRFLSKLYDLRRAHAVAVHGWTAASEATPA